MSVVPISAVGDLQSSSDLDVVLRTYTGEQISVRGVLPVSVTNGGKGRPGQKLLVVQGSGPCLMGRDWLHVIRLDWRNIAKVTAAPPTSDLPSRVAALQERYLEVFTDPIGTITSFHAKLSVTPEAKPKFHKLRPVPYTLKEKVECELD